MPTYEYKCKSCNKTFEKFQSVKEETLKNCIHCDGEVSRVFHPVGVIFKGSGFYTTDYKNKEHKAEKASPPSSKPEKEKAAPCAKKDNCPAASGCS
jgi:putative FmdB family regulatory protein